MLFSIGHSNQTEQQFTALLQQHGIQVLVDVRSQPYSRFSTQFNSEPLQVILTAANIRYMFMGDELGGRPNGLQYYDDEGHVLYHRLSTAPFFLRGIERLIHGMRTYRIAMMCSEENPAICHRHLLISRVLDRRGVEVQHIRGDGSIESEEQVRQAAGSNARQGMLFAELEQDSWRSLRSVLPRPQPPISSEN
jgi:uncharacterized protein (DUF488 family)